MTDAAVSEKAGRANVITVRVEPELWARVAAAAERDGRAVSNWARVALLEKLKEAETC